MAETIDWAKCLLALDVITLSPEVIADTLGALRNIRMISRRLPGLRRGACSTRSARGWRHDGAAGDRGAGGHPCLLAGPRRAALADGPNWVDDGALSLGIASLYALVVRDRAIVYDTHVSPAHGRVIRAELERRGIKKIQPCCRTGIWTMWRGPGGLAIGEIIANRARWPIRRSTKRGSRMAAFTAPPRSAR